VEKFGWNQPLEKEALFILPYLKTDIHKMKPALKITLIYACFGITWILLSDYIELISNADIQTYKGLFYVLLTAVLLYFLVSYYYKELKKKIKLLETLNHDLEKKSRQLELSTMEFERFTYVTSHDLQEPLRMVNSFLHIIEKKYAHTFDEKGKTYIKYALDGAKKIKLIILDLLQFSKADKIETPKEDINLNQIIRESELLLRKQIRKNKALIQYQNLPEIYAHYNPIRQVFHNLIGNAIKFRKENVLPLINIAFQEHSDFWQFAVSDNGIGISKENYEKIFFVFQHTAHTNGYEGNGIGLATCKKIIEQHGGKIWVESIEGKGSTFYFTIPK
jgi:light-regulated signal transduction histidine kinase (bacteriophytochrome)